MRLLFAACMVVFGTACSSVPDRVDLGSSAATNVTQVDLRDARSGEQIAGKRWETQTSTSVTYGDDQFTPSRVQVLRRRLGERLGDQLRGRVITLREFDVSASHAYYVNTSIPGHANPLVHAIEAAKADRQMRSKIVVEISGTELEGAAWRTMKLGSADEGLKTVVVESIEALLVKLREYLAKK